MDESTAKRANGFRVMPRPIPDRWPDEATTPPPYRPDPSLTEKRGGVPPSGPTIRRWWKVGA